MQQIKVKIPKASNIRTIIRKTYRDLYDARKAAMSDDSAYTRKQLEQNIKNASSINGKVVSDIDIKNSSFEEWASSGWKQLYHFHWYFAVTLNRTMGGEIIAVVQDAHYEGEHHNDTLTSQPYDESQNRNGKIVINECDIRRMVKECIRKIIQEDIERKCGPNGYYIERNGLPIVYKGQKMNSIISVVYKNGGQAYHICEDDHCYVFYASTNGVKNAERYENPYIFDELLEAIKMLPAPS